MKESNNNTSYSHNVVAVGTKINGKIFTETDIRIDGELDGEIVCSSKIIVGTTGLIKGKINCNGANIMGSVEAQIIASGIVELKKSAKFTGDIETNVIAIEPDAYFTGTCKMPKKE
jgi:cytoskeletal protein CcmA (bactofilin family)